MKRIIFSVLILISSLSACESNSPSQVTTPAPVLPTPTPPANAASEAAVSTPEIVSASAKTAVKPDGQALYASNCQQCHQAGGTGLPGAFPPLRGSPVVNSADATQLTTIVLHGYNARPEYGAMPGYAANLSDDQIAAINTYVRSAWGNTGKAVAAATVRKVRATSK